MVDVLIEVSYISCSNVIVPQKYCYMYNLFMLIPLIIMLTRHKTITVLLKWPRWYRFLTNVSTYLQKIIVCNKAGFVFGTLVSIISSMLSWLYLAYMIQYIKKCKAHVQIKCFIILSFQNTFRYRFFTHIQQFDVWRFDRLWWLFVREMCL